MSTTIHTGIDEIRGRLLAVRTEEIRVRVLHGLVQTALTAIGLVILLVLVEALLHGSAAMRIALVAAAAAVLFGAFVFFAGRPLAVMLHLVKGESDDTTARRVGEAFPDIQDRLLNLFQLLRTGEGAAGYHSLDLVDAAFADLAGTIRARDFSVMIDRAPLRAAAKVLPMALVFCIVLLVLLPGTLGGAAYRLAFFTREFAPPPEYIITVMPGNVEIVKGARVEITARIQGTLRHPVSLLVRPEGQSEPTEQQLDPAADGLFHATLENLHPLCGESGTHRKRSISSAVAGPAGGEYVALVRDCAVVHTHSGTVVGRQRRRHHSAPGHAGALQSGCEHAPCIGSTGVRG